MVPNGDRDAFVVVPKEMAGKKICLFCKFGENIVYNSYRGEGGEKGFFIGEAWAYTPEEVTKKFLDSPGHWVEKE